MVNSCPSTSFNATAVKWYNEVRTLSLKNNYKPGLIYYRFYEGFMLSGNGKYDEAIAKTQSCINGLDSLGIVQLWQYPLYQIRFMYFSAGKPVDMFRYFTEKVAYYKKHGPIENTAACYHSLGKYYLFIANESYNKVVYFPFRTKGIRIRSAKYTDIDAMVELLKTLFSVEEDFLKIHYKVFYQSSQIYIYVFP